MIRRLGTVAFPVDIVLRYEGRGPERVTWDGQGTWKELTRTGPHRLLSAHIDPEHRVDARGLTRSTLRGAPIRPHVWRAAWSARWMFWVQNLLAGSRTVTRTRAPPRCPRLIAARAPDGSAGARAGDCDLVAGTSCSGSRLPFRCSAGCTPRPRTGPKPTSFASRFSPGGLVDLLQFDSAPILRILQAAVGGRSARGRPREPAPDRRHTRLRAGRVARSPRDRGRRCRALLAVFAGDHRRSGDGRWPPPRWPLRPGGPGARAVVSSQRGSRDSCGLAPFRP